MQVNHQQDVSGMKEMKFDRNTSATIHAEMELARNALEEGNEGMARVCARRAAGAALAAASRYRDWTSGTPSAMSFLEAASLDALLPAAVREAAARLRAKRDEKGFRAVTNDPLLDATIVINFFESLTTAME